jgi:NADPH:quinone reductase-like Zn-dependent oxidoreductase
VVFDTVGALDYTRAAPMLAKGGRFVPLNFGLGDVWKGRKARRNGHAQILKVNGDTKEGLDRLVELIAAGQLRPVIDTVYPFDEIRAAHEKVETRRRKGAIVLEIGATATIG